MNRFISWFLIIFELLSLHRYINGSPAKDSTDPENGRSGLVLHIDNLTGCHYISKPFGGVLTPRVDSHGEHVCHGQE